MTDDAKSSEGHWNAADPREDRVPLRSVHIDARSCACQLQLAFSDFQLASPIRIVRYLRIDQAQRFAIRPDLSFVRIGKVHWSRR